MPDSVLGFVLWRDAKADPPEEGRYVWTDLNEASYFGGRWIVVGDDGEGSPSVWCDPVPPGDDALTLGDVDEVLMFAEDAGIANYDRRAKAAARLRGAIDAAE